MLFQNIISYFVENCQQKGYLRNYSELKFIKKSLYSENKKLNFFVLGILLFLKNIKDTVH